VTRLHIRLEINIIVTSIQRHEGSYANRIAPNKAAFFALGDIRPMYIS
jgi:hypothetical protein